MLEDLYKHKERVDLILIDTLPEEHYRKRHLPGARNACVYQVTFADQVAAIVPDLDREIVLYGSGGQSLDARTAADKLLRLGYRRVHVLTGGIEAWRLGGWPVEGEDPAGPDDPECVRREDRVYRLDPARSSIGWTGRNPNTRHFGTVRLADGEIIPADTVIVSIGEAPDLSFLPQGIATERGFIKVSAEYRTSDPKIFAIGDVVRPGLLTEAIGAGRRVAQAICDELDGRTPAPFRRQMIEKRRVTLEYFDPRIVAFNDLSQCGSQCLSCGACRDCGVCVAVCPQGAIRRRELAGKYEYAVDENLCIGCGFCAGACPCGVWNLEENFPLE